MSLGGWETVVNKKGNKNVKNSSKGLKKSSLESMPRIQPLAPVKESPTIYQAFLEEELRKERKLLEAEKGNNSKEVKKTNANQLHKKKDRRMTLKDSLMNLDKEEIEEILKKDEATFPKNPDIWLKDLASFLNSKLDHISDSDPILADKPIDYPLCVMTDPLKEFFIKRLKGFNAQVYDALMDHCVDSMMNAISKDQSSIGYRLTIQLLLQEHADVVLNNFTKYETLIQRNTSRPLRCLCILWAVAQVGNFSLSHGIKMWFALMFGLIKVKNLSGYVLGYLENLFERYPHLEEGHNSMSKTDYFKFFGELYSELSTLPSDTRKRLHLLYPNVKAVAWGNVSNNLNLFFIGYLSRLTSDCHEAKKTELLQCLTACLENDVLSFTHWRREYHKHLFQSSLLLRHLEINFEKLKSNKNNVLDTVEVLQSINEELVEKLPKQSPIKSCTASCKAILLRKSKKSVSTKPYLLTVTLIAGILIFGDIYAHGSLKDSLGQQWLSNIICQPVIKEALEKCSSLFGRASAWLFEGLRNAYLMVEPLLQHPKFVEYVVKGKQMLWESFEMLSEKVVSYMPELLQYLELASNFSVSILTIVTSKVLESCTFVYNYILENILVGKLSPDNVAEEMSKLVLVLKDEINNLFSRFLGQ